MSIYDLPVCILSVQCNTLHGTEYKITCGVCLYLRTGIGDRISRKRSETEVRF